MYTAGGLCSCAFVGALYTIITAYRVEQPIKLTANSSERDPFNIAKYVLSSREHVPSRTNTTITGRKTWSMGIQSIQTVFGNA